MSPPSSIRMKCPNCGAVARGKESHIARDTKCPKCQRLVRFVAIPARSAKSTADATKQPPTPPPRSQPAPTRTSSRNDRHEPAPQRPITEDILGSTTFPDTGESDAEWFTNEDKTTRNERPSRQQFDSHQTIGTWIAGGGLLVLCLSPFLKWIKIGDGGVMGLSGDGKILLAITVIAAIAYLSAIIRRKWLAPVFLAVQAWGTLAVFWTGVLLWKVGSVLDSADVKGNPFATMSSTRLISPGAGLYLGLIGGIAVAGALGFVAVRHLLLAGNLKPFCASQGLSCLLGILLAVFVGPGRSPKSDDIGLGSLFSSQAKEENVIDAQLGETFAIGNLEITPRTIELVTLDERPTSGDPKPRESKSYVLTFVAQNKSEGQVFSPFSTSSVVDDVGNEYSDPTDGKSTSYVQIDGNEYLKDIGPGQSAAVMVAFDPALESAKEYIWTISTLTSNQDDYEQWRISFSPNDALFVGPDRPLKSDDTALGSTTQDAATESVPAVNKP